MKTITEYISKKNPPQLQQLLQKSPYQAYVYSYPHKTAYRPIKEPIPLSQVWSEIDKQALFLYIHVPFCEMRCGFCNLFTMVQHNSDFVTRYVNTIKRQARQVKMALGESSFARFAVGGGTPTRLPLHQLETILDIAEETMGAQLQIIPGSVEVSPETAEKEKLQLLRDRGIDRVSIGVQSFIDTEVLASGRKQKAIAVEAALTHMKETGFPTINIDLIYGLPGQTVASWLYSIRQALRFQPEEIYLYPLYVRPLTGMGVSQREWDDIRLACYREGRSLLLGEGYTQVSLRMFRSKTAKSVSGPVYCCQADGMVGLGCGARSYTERLHYSREYAVGAREVGAILEAFINTECFDYVNYGFQLDLEDRKRRYILLSLLSEEGLNLDWYGQRFGSEAIADFPELAELLSLELAAEESGVWGLNELGIERSDTIGYWFFSHRVRELMGEYELR